MGFHSFFSVSRVLLLSCHLLANYKSSPVVWGFRLFEKGDAPLLEKGTTLSGTKWHRKSQHIHPSLETARGTLLGRRTGAFEQGTIGLLPPSGVLTSSSLPDENLHFYSALQNDQEHTEDRDVLTSADDDELPAVEIDVDHDALGIPVDDGTNSFRKQPLRSRLQNVRALWSRVKQNIRWWRRSASRWTRAVIRERLLPFLHRLRFWERGLPPEVPPLAGAEPGQYAVARYAWTMSAGILYKPVQERHLSLLEQAVGKYFLPAGAKTWFASRSGRRMRLLKRGLVGRGSFGLVFHVEHPLTREVFALKIFARDRDEVAWEIDPEEVEAERHIVNMFGADWTPERIYSEKHFMVPLETVAVEGKPSVVNVGQRFQILNSCLLFPKAQGDLLSLLAQIDKSEQAFIARMSVTIQMIKLLASFHALDLVHGDVKPDNFLVDRSGLLLLADFTRFFKRDTVGDLQVFTIAYMAPEIANVWTGWTSKIKYEPSVDSWPLGYSIHKVWCNTLPFGILPWHDAAQVIGLLRQARASSLRFQNCNGIPATIQEVVRHLLTKSPAKRLTPQQALDQFSLLQEWRPAAQVTPLSDRILGEPLREPEPPLALRGSFDPRLPERRHTI